MNTQGLIKQLGYEDNSAFLQGGRLKEHHGYSFFFTQAQQKWETSSTGRKGCNLEGVYSLIDSSDKDISGNSLTPVVYVCKADNESQASQIHRRVWNQNIVPFVIVVTPKNIRLYSGFEYDDNKSDEEQVLQVARDANEVLDKLSAFTSKAIDSGDIWQQQGVPTEKRVDRHLLANLKKLSEVLTGRDYGLAIEDTHSLIGKYIYLKYLRDRGILSNEKLSEFGISEDQVYSSGAQKEKLYQLEKHLNVFLNGSVFPLPSRKKIESMHIKKVAGAFRGDDPKSGQQVLFEMYDFSYVPIETLSVVYQQFLHQKGESRSKGAYYTPVHLVNFILDELNAKKPLKEGMKVFDPSCGSGAFLVQSYRRLVESVLIESQRKLRPTELRKLLVDHIFGLDADEEACRVSELSLSLTLLDYIDPPDLKTYPSFKLPDLHDKNIFYCKGGFFDDKSPWAKFMSNDKSQMKYEWIVGNPPWKSKYDLREKYDEQALDWINSNQQQFPVGKQQLAEAFAWKATQLLTEEGQCGFLMPAMTLVKKTGRTFRSEFFSRIEVWCVVNFSNLRHKLFEGADNPTAAFFFSGSKDWNKDEHYVTSFAPFAVEQSSLLNSIFKSKQIWAILANYSIVKEIHIKDITGGSSTPWKVAMWGTHRDNLLLVSLRNKKFPSLKELVQQKEFKLSEGLQLRFPSSDDSKKNKFELCNEVKGGNLLLMKELKGAKHIHSFLDDHFETISSSKDVYTRHGRKDRALSICYPPHIILDECRRFAVYSEQFLVVPPHQIGLSASEKSSIFLKALALFLKSDLAYYLQFWSAVKMGIERDVFNLDDLKKLDIPLDNLTQEEIVNWAELHDKIVETEKLIRKAKHCKEMSLFESNSQKSLPSLTTLLNKLNSNVYEFLGINKKQRWLIEDMLSVRIKLNDGKVAKEAVKQASKKEISDFAAIFQEELDLFLDHSGERRVHKVKVLYTESNAVIVVDHLKRSSQTTPEVVEVKDSKTKRELELLQEKLTETSSSQWMYFTRCLRIYDNRKTYIFKPRQRLYWLKSQALVEADEFIAEKLS